MIKKQVSYKGELKEVILSDDEIKKLQHHADIAKLNGRDEDYFVRDHKYGYFRDFEEELRTIFRESKPELKVGLGCTINLYTDRLAATITKVISPRKVEVTTNKVECLDWFNSDYKILDELDERGSCCNGVYTLRKNGTWVEMGQPKKVGSVTLTVGFRHHYVDPSF